MAVSFSVKRKITFIFDSWYDYPGVLAAYDFKNASDQSNSYINLANPGTYNLSVNVAPSWTSGQGLIFTGTQSLNTGIVPISTSTIFARFSNASGAPIGVAGIFNIGTGTRFYLRPRHDDFSKFYGYGSTALNSSGAVNNGIMALTGNNAYYNGASLGTVSGTWTDAPLSIYIGAINDNNNASVLFNGTIEAIWIGNQLLDSTQVSNLTTEMANL